MSEQVVYPTFVVSDDWGRLNVTDGALVPSNFSKVTIAAPANVSEPHVEGPGWTLDLAQGWRIEPGPVQGNFIVRKR